MLARNASDALIGWKWGVYRGQIHDTYLVMASAQQLIGLVKSHAEGDSGRFYDLAMQLSAAEEQKGHTRLAEQLRQWANAGQAPSALATPTAIAAPRGDLGGRPSPAAELA